MTNRSSKKPEKSKYQHSKEVQQIQVASEKQVKELFEKSMKQFSRTIKSLANR